MMMSPATNEVVQLVMVVPLFDDWVLNDGAIPALIISTEFLVIAIVAEPDSNAVPLIDARYQPVIVPE